MNAKLPPPKRQLPAVTNGQQQQLPAVARPNPIKALKKFRERADDLAYYLERLRKAIDRVDIVKRAPFTKDADAILGEAAEMLESYDRTYCKLAQELRLDLAKFNPADAYDEDGEITEERVRVHIGLLLGASNANPGNPEAYAGAMVAQVHAECPSVIVLESACDQIRCTVNFLPSTAEVIAAIREQDELWSPRLDAIDDCAYDAEELREKLETARKLVDAEKAKREEERRAAEEKKRADNELRAKPLVVGDRVAFDTHHRGVVVEAGEEDEFNHAWADVVFDDAWRKVFSKHKLTRLLPGDSNYAPFYSTVSQNKTKLPVVGDRVFVKTLGPGTVVPDKHWIMIRLDDGQLDNISAEQWKEGAAAGLICRLLHGERYFVAGQEVWDRRDGWPG